MARDEEGGAPLPAVYGCLGNQIQDDTGRRGSVCVCAEINTKNETLMSSQSRRNGRPGVCTPAFLPSHKRREASQQGHVLVSASSNEGAKLKLLPQMNKNDMRKRNATDLLFHLGCTSRSSDGSKPI